MPGIATAVVLVVGVAAWLVWPSEADVRAQNQMITVVDGPGDDQRVTLDTSFFPPAGGGRAPAVLLAHGFGGSKQSVRDAAVRLARDGYAVLTWSARGFGRSSGQIALNSPDYEVKDVRQLVDWVARRPEVRLDAAGDPRVGVAGGSYGGAIALMAAAHDPRIDAIVPQITWYDLADALFPNATGQGPESGVFKRMWAGLFFSRGGPTPGAAGLASLGGSGADREEDGEDGADGAGPPPAQPRPLTAEEVRCGRFLPEICDMYQKVAESGRATADAVKTLRRSSPISVPGRIKVPTLLLQGQRDSLFTLGQADANAKAIAATGAPVEVAWFDGGHDGGDGEVDWLHDRTLGWFDRHLKEDGGAGQGGGAFTVTRDGGRDPRHPAPGPAARRRERLSGAVRHRPDLRTARRGRPAGGQPARRVPLLDLRGPRLRRSRRSRHREPLDRHGGPERHLRLRPAGRPAPGHRQLDRTGPGDARAVRVLRSG
ncbi:hypothetical protein GCM10018952_12380 [Streptosporangium vulgare]